MPPPNNTPIPESNTAIDLPANLINLTTYRKADRTAGNKPDPVICLTAYAQDELIYENGRIITAPTPQAYAAIKSSTDVKIRNQLVNKFGLAYPRGMPLLLHRRLADVLIDSAIDLRDRFQYFTVTMDGLRTFESAERLQNNRPDLVKSGMLSPAGTSAHNRALAVDSKLFTLIDPQSFSSYQHEIPLSALTEADEHGHLDDEQDMTINSRFYTGPMSESAKHNRLQRLIAWQRASVKNKTPIANLLAEFWDDRVPGSPADLWRVTACRLLCVGADANPKSNMQLQSLRTALNALPQTNRTEFAQQAHQLFAQNWQHIFTHTQLCKLEALLGPHGAITPPLENFIFHEWLENIHDHHIQAQAMPIAVMQ